MTYLVCKEKESGSLFITTRSAREALLKMLSRVNEPPDSIVLKSVATYADALKYKSDIEQVDKKLNNLL